MTRTSNLLPVGKLAIEIDSLIKGGSLSQARTRLNSIRTYKIPRQSALVVASLARRAGLYQLALQILNPIVRPIEKSWFDATDSERAEYAASLIKIGALDEALAILRNINANKLPEILLFQSYALMAQWNYGQCIPLLERYIHCSSVTPYQRLVGKVNLAAALVTERMHTQAATILTELLEETAKKELHLLYGNALEISAQSAISQQRWQTAESLLTLAQTQIGKGEALDEFFVRKWLAFLRILKPGEGRTSFDTLHSVRQEAFLKRHWETLRDCDLFEAVITGSENLLLHVYFGTPYEAYRNRIFLEYNRPLEIPDTFVWMVAPHSQCTQIVDLVNTENSKEMHYGSLIHRLFGTLASDFYRPLRLGSIYSSLYPQENFNPISSPMRVHQAIKRLREWIAKNKIALEIVAKAGGYRLVGTCSSRLGKYPLGIKKQQGCLATLRKQYAQNEFSSIQAHRSLGMSLRTTLRLLSRANQEGRIVRIGAGSLTRYKIL